MDTIENKRFTNDTITLFQRWLENRNNGKTFADYFHEYGCNSIIIVDAGEIGRILYNEIKDSDIKVVCFYDRNAEGIGYVDDIPVYPFSKIMEIPRADMTVISTVYDYTCVLEMLTEADVHIRSVYMRDAVYEF